MRIHLAILVPLLGFSWQAAAIEKKSDLLTADSGHYAQVILQPQTVIQPVKFKPGMQISLLNNPNCVGLVIQPSGPVHVSGTLSSNSCVIQFAVQENMVASPITVDVELFRLAQAPTGPEAAELLASLPVVDESRVKILITSAARGMQKQIPVEKDVDDIYCKGRPASGNRPAQPPKADLTSDIFLSADNTTTGPDVYSSCEFNYSFVETPSIVPAPLCSFNNKELTISLTPDQVGLTAADKAIESCEFRMLVTYKPVGRSDDTTDTIAPVTYHILKSYL